MKIDRKKLEQEAQEKGMRMIILFGSQVEGTANDQSDYDVAVLTTKEKNIGENMENYNDALYLFCRLFGVREDKIDLTNLNNSSPFLNNEVARNSRLIYGNEMEFAAFKAFAMREYIATQDLRDLEEKLIYKRHKILADKIYA